MFSTKTILSCLAAVVLSQSAYAVVPIAPTPTMPFNNLSEANNGSIAVSSAQWMTASAVVGATPTTISSLVLKLGNYNATAPLLVQLCADNAGQPNLTSCQVFTAASNPIPAGPIDVSFSGMYNAAANATVWIVASSTATVGSYGWIGSNSTAWRHSNTHDQGVTWNFPPNPTVQELLYSISGTPSAAPTASAVTITGTPQVGNTLTGSYTYSDFEGDPQGNSTRRWMSGGKADGSDKLAIAGATYSTYSLVAADGGKYLFYCVTPVALTGVLTGTETCSSGSQFVLVSNISSATAVTGIGPNQVSPLDLASGYGPALTNCLMTTIRQLLGQDAVYLGQFSGGGTRVSQGGKIVSFYALRAGGDASQSQGIHLLAGNALNMGTSCGNLDMAPALYNPTEFGAALTGMGLSATIDASGVITITGNGNVYVVRPDYFVTPGQTAGAGLKLGADGLYRFTDSAGNSQVLRAAFLSVGALQASASSALGGYIVIQTDGTALFTQLNGTQSVLSPDLVLGSIPAGFALSTWWSDGANHYRFPIGFASQGLTQTAK